MTRRHGRRLLTPLLLGAISLGACGDDGGPKAPPGVSQTAFERQLAEAQNVSAADFPSAAGKTLQQLADTAQAGNQLGLAASVFVPGENRLAFGVLDAQNSFVYGKTAVYVARSPDSRAEGPFPAPADALLTEGRFRSKQAALEDSPIASIYAAQVPFKRTGSYSVLVLTKAGGQLLGATSEVGVRRATPIPSVGERPPAIDTDTIASPQGDEEAVDTRIPAAPELHQDNIDNQVDKGLRRPLLEFGLETEPWLFTIDRTGKVAARLEGSFGLAAFERAVRAALD